MVFTLALHGEEVPLIELQGIQKHWNQSVNHTTPHIVISLLGRFKNEIGESYHLMPVLATTPRGLEPHKWVERVLDEYRHINVTFGYMFRNYDGMKMKLKTLESKFYDPLELIKLKRPDLIDREVEVSEEYGLSQSFWRGGTSKGNKSWGTPSHNRVEWSLEEESPKWCQQTKHYHKRTLH